MLFQRNFLMLTHVTVQVEAGKKGGAISAQASPEERHERAMKAGDKQRGQPKGSNSD